MWDSTKELRKVNRNSIHYSPEQERIGLKQRQYKIKADDNKKINRSQTNKNRKKNGRKKPSSGQRPSASAEPGSDTVLP